MKAVEFIAKFGWDEAIQILKEYPYRPPNFTDYWEALEEHIDAYELIKKLGSIQAAKDAAYQNTMNVDGFDPSKIESAIALVEEVEKFKGVA